MFYLALSCLQGRRMDAAFAELAALEAGIQLTPGNYPRAGFTPSGTTRRHHGFRVDARKSQVWCEDTGACLADSESVHPPRLETRAAGRWRAWYEKAGARPIVEVMYPGYALGTGDEVEEAMRDGLPLAVDISHVFIQLESGAMRAETWKRLQDHPAIEEVHVSSNGGRFDTHAPIHAGTFGLDWARARLAAGTPTVLESYMHRMPRDDRRRQIDLVRTGSD